MPHDAHDAAGLAYLRERVSSDYPHLLDLFDRMTPSVVAQMAATAAEVTVEVQGAQGPVRPIPADEWTIDLENERQSALLQMSQVNIPDVGIVIPSDLDDPLAQWWLSIREFSLGAREFRGAAVIPSPGSYVQDPENGVPHYPPRAVQAVSFVTHPNNPNRLITWEYLTQLLPMSEIDELGHDSQFPSRLVVRRRSVANALLPLRYVSYPVPLKSLNHREAQGYVMQLRNARYVEVSKGTEKDWRKVMQFRSPEEIIAVYGDHHGVPLAELWEAHFYGGTTPPGVYRASKGDEKVLFVIPAGPGAELLENYAKGAVGLPPLPKSMLTQPPSVLRTELARYEARLRQDRSAHIEDAVRLLRHTLGRADRTKTPDSDFGEHVLWSGSSTDIGIEPVVRFYPKLPKVAVTLRARDLGAHEARTLIVDDIVTGDRYVVGVPRKHHDHTHYDLWQSRDIASAVSELPKPIRDAVGLVLTTKDVAALYPRDVVLGLRETAAGDLAPIVLHQTPNVALTGLYPDELSPVVHYTVTGGVTGTPTLPGSGDQTATDPLEAIRLWLASGAGRRYSSTYQPHEPSPLLVGLMDEAERAAAYLKRKEAEDRRVAEFAAEQERQRLAEEAQRKAEEAQRKAEEERRRVEEASARVEPGVLPGFSGLKELKVRKKDLAVFSIAGEWWRPSDAYDSQVQSWVRGLPGKSKPQGGIQPMYSDKFLGHHQWTQFDLDEVAPIVEVIPWLDKTGAAEAVPRVAVSGPRIIVIGPHTSSAVHDSGFDLRHPAQLRYEVAQGAGPKWSNEIGAVLTPKAAQDPSGDEHDLVRMVDQFIHDRQYSVRHGGGYMVPRTTIEAWAQIREGVKNPARFYNGEVWIDGEYPLPGLPDHRTSVMIVSVDQNYLRAIAKTILHARSADWYVRVALGDHKLDYLLLDVVDIGTGAILQSHVLMPVRDDAPERPLPPPSAEAKRHREVAQAKMAGKAAGGGALVGSDLRDKQPDPGEGALQVLDEAWSDAGNQVLDAVIFRRSSILTSGLTPWQDAVPTLSTPVKRIDPGRDWGAPFQTTIQVSTKGKMKTVDVLPMVGKLTGDPHRQSGMGCVRIRGSGLDATNGHGGIWVFVPQEAQSAKVSGLVPRMVALGGGPVWVHATGADNYYGMTPQYAYLVDSQFPYLEEVLKPEPVKGSRPGAEILDLLVEAGPLGLLTRGGELVTVDGNRVAEWPWPRGNPTKDYPKGEYHIASKTTIDYLRTFQKLYPEANVLMSCDGAIVAFWKLIGGEVVARVAVAVSRAA